MSDGVEITTAIAPEMLEIKERKKRAKEIVETPAINYMVISFGYSCNFCLPYAEGAKFIAALQHAEKVDTYYASNGLKFQTGAVEFETKIITQAEYREKKMAFLLGVD
jgi:hypothetical protein